MAELTLYLPGLYGPFLRYPDEPLPDLPGFRQLLIHGQHKKIVHKLNTARIADLFGYPHAGEIPVAAITRLIDDTSRPEGFWIRADPVYLEAQHNGMILHDASRFTLSQQDALVIATLIQPVLNEFNFKLEVPHPTRWYLGLPEPDNTLFKALDEVNGKNIQNYLPQGEQQILYLRIFNDIQMVLHESEINQKRKQQNQTLINSIWFWGNGRLPAVLKRQWSKVYSDNPLAQGLSMLSGTEYYPWVNYKNSLENALPTSKILFIDERLSSFERHDNFYAWQQALIVLEREYFSLWVEALQKKYIESITIISDEAACCIYSRDLLKIWRRRHSLNQLLRQIK